MEDFEGVFDHRGGVTTRQPMPHQILNLLEQLTSGSADGDLQLVL